VASIDVENTPAGSVLRTDRVRATLRLSRRQEHVGLLLVWLVASAWVWARLDQGWVAHDDGGFAQSATRVLDGQLPHREFAELYTGGMTFMNAAAIFLFGEDLIVLRYPLFAVFLGLVPAVYYIARRVSGPWTSLLTAALACTWSVPIYPAAVPSWYLLLFSVYGAACLIAWRATQRDRWLLAAGVIAGVSIAFKIVGVYFVVAALLFLVFVHQRRRDPGRFGLDWASLGALALAGGLLASVLGSRLGSPEIVNLVLPVAAVAVAVAVERARGASVRSDRASAGSLPRSLGVFLGGVALPIALLLVPYVVSGAAGDFVEGVFVSPQSRREFAYWPTPAPATLVLALLLIGALFIRSRLSHPGRRVLDVALTALAFGALVAAASDRTAYATIWDLGRGMGPLIVLAGVGLLLVRRRGQIDRERREIVFLLVALVALVSLVQFPFGIPLYYCYVAPLVALAAVAVASDSRKTDRWLICVLVATFALYGAAYLDRASHVTLTYRFVRDGQVAVLDRDRASIRVLPREAAAVREIVALLRRHSHGGYTFTGPDTPQLYFLADLDNPTRSLFDFLDTSDSARGAALLARLREKGVTAIAINRHPSLSKPLDARTLDQLSGRYPNLERVGRIDVRWAN
jgi:hypothetical protein